MSFWDGFYLYFIPMLIWYTVMLQINVINYDIASLSNLFLTFRFWKCHIFSFNSFRWQQDYCWFEASLTVFQHIQVGVSNFKVYSLMTEYKWTISLGPGSLDQDPRTQMNADPTGSGSKFHITGFFFRKMDPNSVFSWRTVLKVN